MTLGLALKLVAPPEKLFSKLEDRRQLTVGTLGGWLGTSRGVEGGRASAGAVRVTAPTHAFVHRARRAAWRGTQSLFALCLYLI